MSSIRYSKTSLRIWSFSALLLALLLLVIAPTAAQESPFDLDRIERATVFIMQARQSANAPVVTCVGSGTIVSRNGLILTNAHHTVTNDNCPGTILIIALSVRPDETPFPLYQAEIVQADIGLDLALLRITRQNDGRLIDQASLALPFVEVADSEEVRLDSTITMVGYPGIGDEPITAVRGTVLGFTGEPSGGDRSWIKSSVSIPGTMTGGAAYNQDGELIGIPTTAPIDRDSPEATCVIIQDTNADGLANANDDCIPMGGFLNSLRPSNFARPLIRAASLGLDVEFLNTSAIVSSSAADQPRFSRLFFSSSVNEAGMPTSVIRSLPSGGTSLYLFFDYYNMTPETVYELRVTVDGVVNPTFSLSPVRWSGGQDGLWYVGTTEQPLPNGVYEYTLLIDGIIAGTQRIVVGRSEPTPTFTDIVFGVEDARGNIAGNGYVLPVAATVSARFIFRNMTENLSWAAIWFREGEEIAGSRVEETWAYGTEGTRTIRIQSPTGLPPGTYRLDLYIDNRLSATSNLTLAGAQDGRFARIFAETRFTTADSAVEARTSPPITSFTAGTESLYALFDWQLMGAGTLWTLSWYVDEDLFFQQTAPWRGAETGEDFTLQLIGRDGIPDGTYRLELSLNNLEVASQSARVGIGQLPIDRFASATGVQIRGTILDALSGEGITGATVFIVTEDYSAADFMTAWQQDQLYATAVTDRNGRFEIDRLLEPEIQYSLVIVADGYVPILADGVEVTLDDNPVDLPIYMTRG